MSPSTSSMSVHDARQARTAPARWAGLLCSVVAGLTACASTSPDVVGRHDAQRLSTVMDAVVLSSRAVTVEGTQSGVGSTAGGLVGGIVASQLGGARDAMVASVVGAVVGGVLGNIAERSVRRQAALEVLVLLQSGDRRVVVQAAGAETFEAGDAVVLISTSGKVRVTKWPAALTPDKPAEGSAPSKQRD